MSQHQVARYFPYGYSHCHKTLPCPLTPCQNYSIDARPWSPFGMLVRPISWDQDLPPLCFALLWGEFLERSLLYLSIPLAPQEPQHSSVFSSPDPPSFLPILPTSASLVLPMEAQLNHLPFVGKRQHQPPTSTNRTRRLGSGGIWAESFLTSPESICEATLLWKIPVIFRIP